MRLYEFKNNDDTLDLILVTDGIKGQERVFITESPREVVEGSLAKTQALGFNFEAGKEIVHNEVIDFALTNDLECIEWDEGLKNEAITLTNVDGEQVLRVRPTVNSGIVHDKSSFCSIVAPSYQKDYPWNDEDYVNWGFPWIWLNLEKVPQGKGTFNLQIAKDGKLCDFVGRSSEVGTISSDKKTITATAQNYISFEAVNDLGIAKGAEKGTYTAIFTSEDGLNRVEVNYVY